MKTLLLILILFCFKGWTNEDFLSVCKGEYQASPGYRQFSPKEQDLRACKGVVGESFCIDDKQEEFLESCAKEKQRLAEILPKKPVDVEIPIKELEEELGPLPKTEDSGDNDEPSGADSQGFRDL